MRRQSQRAPAYFPVLPPLTVAFSANVRGSRQDGRRCCNNLTRPVGMMRVGESTDPPRKTGAICGA
jgi:hypothetical protein